MIPTPSRRVSCRLVVSHAGFADPDHLLYQLFLRGQQLLEVGKDLRAGSGMLMHWSHEPLHPSWQTAKWLDEMRRELPPQLYAPMIENQFVPAAASYITNALYDRAETATTPPYSDLKLEIYVGVDAAYLRDNAAVFAVTLDGDNVRLVFHKIFQPSADNPLDFEETIEKTLLELNKRYRIRSCLVDEREMVYLVQRLQKAKLPITALKQTPQNLTMMAQGLFDAFHSGRLSVYPDAQVRDIVTRTVFEESTSGLRFARDQVIKKDATVALSMALVAALQNTGKPRYRGWEVYDPNFIDDDAPKPPPPTPASAFDNSVFAGSWWKLQQPATYVEDANEQLKRFYKSLNGGELDRTQ